MRVPPLVVDRAGGFLKREASVCLERACIHARLFRQTCISNLQDNR